MISMHFLRGRAVALLVLIVAAALILAACNGDDGDGATPTPTPTAPPATTPTPAETPADETPSPTPEPAAALQISVAEDDELGAYLVGPDGMTLYIFLRDAPNQSNCTGDCLAAWPPLLLEDGQEVEANGTLNGEFGDIEVPDGRQVTYREAPLYYWASDVAEGDTTGHEVGGVWFVARPDTASTAVINVQTEGDLAPYLVGPDGMTLYLFTNDEPDVSNCSGDCAANWPPLTVPNGFEPTAVDDAPGELGVIERDDGLGRQVTYNGIPLYYWAADNLPGETTGHEVGGVWFVVPPEEGNPAAAVTVPADEEEGSDSEDGIYTY